MCLAIPMLLKERTEMEGVVELDGIQRTLSLLLLPAAEVIAARRSGQSADPLALHFPTATDGLIGVRFIERVMESTSPLIVQALVLFFLRRLSTWSFINDCKGEITTVSAFRCSWAIRAGT